MNNKIKSTVQIGDKSINYNWILSSRKTKTISASIDSNFEIVVKSPLFMTKELVDDFVVKSYPNLQKRLFLKYNNSYFNLAKNRVKILGIEYIIFISLGYTKSMYKIVGNQINLKLKNPEDKHGIIKKILTKETERIILPMTLEKAKILNLEVRKVGVRDTKRSWAYTKHLSKFIFFNYKLVVFEKEVIDYVICHELMHLIFPNHSKEFWFYVSKICPNYRIYRKILKNFF